MSHNPQGIKQPAVAGGIAPVSGHGTNAVDRNDPNTRQKALAQFTPLGGGISQAVPASGHARHPHSASAASHVPQRRRVPTQVGGRRGPAPAPSRPVPAATPTAPAAAPAPSVPATPLATPGIAPLAHSVPVAAPVDLSPVIEPTPVVASGATSPHILPVPTSPIGPSPEPQTSNVPDLSTQLRDALAEKAALGEAVLRADAVITELTARVDHLTAEVARVNSVNELTNAALLASPSAGVDDGVKEAVAAVEGALRKNTSRAMREAIEALVAVVQ